MTSIGNKNYDLVDVLKFVFAFFVVGIHTHPFETFGEYLNLFSNEAFRLAVPFFFLCSGFFFFKKLSWGNGKLSAKDKKENFKILFEYEKRLIILYLIWTFVYFAVSVLEYYKNGVLTLGSIKSYVVSIFLQGSYYHLWYVVALIIAVAVLYFLSRYLGIKFIIPIIPALWIVQIIISCRNQIPIFETIASFTDPLYIFQKVVFRALPLIGLGVTFVFYRPKRKWNIISLIISFVFLIVGTLVINRWFLHKSDLMWLVLIPVITYFLFAFVSESAVQFENKSVFKTLRAQSSFIYFFHPAVITVIELLGYEKLGILPFLITSAVSYIVSLGIVKLSEFKKLHFLAYAF